MDQILHPITGEQGYFCSSKEKEVIDAIISDYKSIRGESE